MRVSYGFTVCGCLLFSIQAALPSAYAGRLDDESQEAPPLSRPRVEAPEVDGDLNLGPFARISADVMGELMRGLSVSDIHAFSAASRDARQLVVEGLDEVTLPVSEGDFFGSFESQEWRRLFGLRWEYYGVMHSKQALYPYDSVRWMLSSLDELQALLNDRYLNRWKQLGIWISFWPWYAGLDSLDPLQGRFALTPEVIKRLEGLSRLKTLEIRFDSGWEVEPARLFSAALTHLKSLDSLVLERAIIGSPAASFFNGPGVEAGALLAKAFPRSVKIRGLGIAVSRADRLAGIRALSSGLHRAERLRALDLGGNRLEGEGALAFADALQGETRIRELNLEHCELDGAGVEALARQLKRFPQLRVLRLSGNLFGDRGALALAEQLKAVPQLEGLHLVGCGIKESGMTALAKSFFTLRHLKTLDLRFEDISDEGVGHLAHAVRNAPGLKELRLEGPQIGDEGALALAAALERSSLNRLDLIRTSVTRDGFHALLKTLKGMATLEVVDLQGHPWTEEAVEVFAEGF